MLKHYIEIYFPGAFFFETRIQPVTSRDPLKVNINHKNAFAFKFFSRIETLINNDLLTGENKNYSGMFFFNAQTFTLKEIIKYFPNEIILIDNMKINNIKTIVKTKTGNFLPFNENDTLI